MSCLILHNNEPFLWHHWPVTHNKKWILYDNRQQQPAQWMDTEEAPKSTSQSQTCTKKKVTVTGWWSAAVLIHYSFLNPSPLRLRNTLSKSMRCTENRNACSPLWSTEKAQFFSTTTPDHTLHNQYFKSWTNRATKFCPICPIHLTSHQSTTTSSSISTTFCRKSTSTTSRKQEMLSKSSPNPKAWILCYRNKQMYFLLAKMCWL